MNNILDIAVGLSQIVVGFGGSAIAFYTLVINKDLVFRNSLRNKQIRELCHMRKKMYDIWFAVFYVKSHADNIGSLRRALKDFEREQPDAWAQYKAFQSDCTELLYKLRFPNGYLFPKWFDPRELRSLVNKMEQFAPFTMHTLMNKTQDGVTLWQDELLKGIGLLDKSLKKRS